MGLEEKAKHIPFTATLDKWLVRYNALGVKARVSQEYGMNDAIMAFAMTYLSAGMDCFATTCYV